MNDNTESTLPTTEEPQETKPATWVLRLEQLKQTYAEIKYKSTTSSLAMKRTGSAAKTETAEQQVPTESSI